MNYFDFHCDTPYRCYEENGGISDSCFHVSVKKGEYLNKWIQCMAIWIPDEYRGKKAEDLFNNIYDRFVNQKDSLKIIKNKKDFEENDRGFILTAEGGACIGGELENIRTLAQKGVKILTLTWNGENELGGGADTDKGITQFGIKALKELEENGIIIDVSHASDRLFYDVCKHCKKPIVATHSNSRAICSHRRNLTDEQFAAVRDMGGIVGLNFCKTFLKEDGNAGIEHIFEHAEHFLSLGGENTVAIGSDFDGTDLPSGVIGIESIGSVYEFFLKKNYSESLLNKIFYENGYNFARKNIFI